MRNFLGRFLALLTVVNMASCQVHERIVGGVDGNIYDFPWQANLRFQNFPACGASLISPQWIMTACHCFPVGHDYSDYDVVFGTTNLDAPDTNTQIVLIAAVFKNPAYNEDAYSGDIALVKLMKPVTLGPGVAVVTLLAAGTQIPAGLGCYITGWGNTGHGVTLPSPKTLQVGLVKTISTRTCQCLLNVKASSGSSSSDSITTIQPDMLCAGYKDGATDACQGDSGGPLSSFINNKWYQIGVVSWGEECGAQNSPGVYILCSAYMDWIQRTVPDCQVDSVTISQAPLPDDENGCKAADGNYYPYPNRGTAMVLVTVFSLPLYWLSIYLLTHL